MAGYVDGASSVWPSSAWGRFSTPYVVHISTWGPRNLGDCLDIEPGDSVVSEARPWALNAIARGVRHPKLYMSMGDLASVRAATSDLDCRYWVANPTGTPHIPTGADACQYSWIGGYDTSLCTARFFDK